ncbi:kinase-like domain-containing protein [Radiomyces spectabilis]|uniref:kinase-like domain-containing protein n=1 Tax=Radiomyces spectabilis TaxID=64574 RepID=UPI002221176A|nr:kinase-like domain-containing protein [Radiomyces spectabilis]KAI8372780.1 kinase-like domain-containing protein [Radiomyces spectabilis]
MPVCANNDQRQIAVFETTLSVQDDVLSVFHIVIQAPQQSVSLIRYPFDFAEFHQKIKFHYPRSKLPFPHLTAPSSHLRFPTKPHSLKNLLVFHKRKSNAEKVEQYLQRCFQHPIISISSILRDFLSVQRDEDTLIESTIEPSLAIPTPRHRLSRSCSIGTHRQSIQDSPVTPVTPLPTTDHPKMSVDDFHLLKVLGKGCMGKVLLVRSKADDQLYALKAIKKNWVIQQKEVLHTKAERNILAQLRGHPFLITLHHAFQSPSQLFLVLDYYAGGDIATQMSLCSTFSESRTKFYAAEILMGLSFLHGHGIIYRDLKPENVLIGSDGHIVLTDFGLSKVFPSSHGLPMTQTFCGTAEYLAPEVLLGEPYSYMVDYWSFGTLLYEMLSGITPFWAETHMEMYRRVLEDPLEFPPHFDAVTCDLLCGLLEREASERLGWGVKGADQIKRHPYFAGVNWDEVVQKKLTPPYVPELASATDLAHFDEMFVNMTPRISQASNVDTTEEDDPFDQFTYDSRQSCHLFRDRPLPSSGSRSLTRKKPQRPQRKLTEPNLHQRFSSSSSLLSFTSGEVVQHTDTMPSMLLVAKSQPYLRKRHSAAISIHLTDGLHEQPLHTMKRRQTGSGDPGTTTTMAAIPTTAGEASSSNATLKLQSPAISMEGSSSIYSRSSMTFSSAHDGPESIARAESEASDDHTIMRGKNTSYERPTCPVPGQVRPSIALTASDTLSYATGSLRHSLIASTDSSELTQQQRPASVCS